MATAARRECDTRPRVLTVVQAVGMVVADVNYILGPECALPRHDDEGSVRVPVIPFQSMRDGVV